MVLIGRRRFHGFNAVQFPDLIREAHEHTQSFLTLNELGVSRPFEVFFPFAAGLLAASFIVERKKRLKNSLSDMAQGRSGLICGQYLWSFFEEKNTSATAI